MSDTNGQRPSLTFNPDEFFVVPPRSFNELKVGEVFRAPSRTINVAHMSAFQALSGDNHPVHYDAEWTRKHGFPGQVVHGVQVFTYTVPGATLFPHVFGEIFIRLLEFSCKFQKDVFLGDTLYPAHTVTDLIADGATGTLVSVATIYNQRGELILSAEYKFLVRREL